LKEEKQRRSERDKKLLMWYGLPIITADIGTQKSRDRPHDEYGNRK
jgi:hypothetical protein